MGSADSRNGRAAMQKTDGSEIQGKQGFEGCRKYSLTIEAHCFSIESLERFRRPTGVALMADMTFSETIRERIAAVGVVTETIAGKGGETDLRDLRVLLINTMSLLQRDPGVEAAVDDLYAAARAIVKDAAVGFHPVQRNVRFLLSALKRFSDRVPVVAGLSEPDDSMRLRGLEAAYAVQLERTTEEAAEGESEVRSAA